LRALSLTQANRCETAKHPNCRCRCGGGLHGSRRLLENATREDFEALPEDDPHHLPTKEEKKRRAETKRLEKVLAQIKAAKNNLLESGFAREDYF